MVETEKLKTEETQAREKGYETFMRSPMTRFMLSMIPQCEPKETVDTLLRATFDAGFSAGGGAFAAQLASAILSRKGENDGK